MTNAAHGDTRPSTNKLRFIQNAANAPFLSNVRKFIGNIRVKLLPMLPLSNGQLGIGNIGYWQQLMWEGHYRTTLLRAFGGYGGQA